jgi:HD-GYP domain-containing protein (c-di-GMP phosphodiesterase class II)
MPARLVHGRSHPLPVGVLGFLASASRKGDTCQGNETDVLRAAAYNLAASVIRGASEQEVLRSYQKLRNTFNDVIRTMGQIVGKKDPYTIEHQERVVLLATEIGAALGLDGERLEGLRIAGLVHDVGKVEIPSEILSKPGRLSHPGVRAYQDPCRLELRHSQGDRLPLAGGGNCPAAS